MGRYIKKEALAIRKLREIKGFDRKQAAIVLGISYKTVEAMENGRSNLTSVKINWILRAYGFSYDDFVDCCEGRIARLVAKNFKPKPKVIEHKNLKRFNKKIITKDAETLKVLRRLRGATQYQASHMCGYHRTSIGCIENGRVELTEKKIEHIVTSYGFTMRDFEYHKNSDRFVTDIQDDCIKIIQNLDEDKIKAVYPLLKTFNIKSA